MTIYVFGANRSGFHGAGVAGLLCRGDARNNWRQDKWFLKAIKSPKGSLDRIGKMAVVGEIGFQQGLVGASYGIVTIERPGLKRSVELDEIHAQLVDFATFAERHQDWKFIILPLGTGYAGCQKLVLPPNISMGTTENVRESTVFNTTE